MAGRLKRIERLMKAQAHVTGEAEMQVAQLASSLAALEKREQQGREAADNGALAGMFSDFHVQFFHRLAEQKAALKNSLEGAQNDLHRERRRDEKLKSVAVKTRREENGRLEQQAILEFVAARKPQS